MGRRTRPYVAHHPMFCGDGLSCLEPTPQNVTGASPREGGQVGIVAIELRPSGARQQPARRGRRPTAQSRPLWRKRRHHDHEACGVGAHQRCPRRPLRRSGEIILAAIIYLTASCFAVVGTLGFVAAIWVLWGRWACGNPAILNSTNTRGRGRHVL